jgi:hypothetical protein
MIMNCIEKNGTIVKAREENFDACLSLILGKAIPVPTRGTGGGGGAGGMVVALFSDLHVGRKTPSFDSGVAGERVKAYVDYLARLRDEAGSLVVLGLGDYVDGASIYPRQEYEQEMDPNEQVDVAFEISRELFELADSFYGIVGNHGKANEEEQGNYDYFFLLQAKAMMGSKANISKRHNDYFKLPNGQVILASHPPPPRIYSYQGIPDYGVRRFVTMHATANRELSEAYFGHFHIPKISFEQIPVFFNGTFLSDDELARMMGFASRPAQVAVIKRGSENIFHVIRL